MNARPLAAALPAAALIVALSGCSVTGSSSSSGAASPAPGASSSSAASAGVMVQDAWVKSAEAGGMTAIFATVHNHADHDVTLVSATSAAASEVQLHETAPDSSGNLVMGEVAGGFVIPAGGSRVLEPGGDHIMLMGLVAALEPGAELTATLTFDDGSIIDVSAPVKDFAGAEEHYDDDAMNDEHVGH